MLLGVIPVDIAVTIAVVDKAAVAAGEDEQ